MIFVQTFIALFGVQELERELPLQCLKDNSSDSADSGHDNDFSFPRVADTGRCPLLASFHFSTECGSCELGLLLKADISSLSVA